MLISNSKSLGNNVISPEEERERLQWEELNPSRIFSRPIALWRPFATADNKREWQTIIDCWEWLAYTAAHRSN